MQSGQSSVDIGGATIEVPELRESCPHGSLALGIRPEQVRFSDASALRGEVFGTEYLGTNQIVTVETGHGQIRARTPSHQRVEPGRERRHRVQARPPRGIRRERRTRPRERPVPGEPKWLKSRCGASTSAFDELAAVEGVDLDVADGEFLVLLGPTGAGKTTTLRLIAGLEKPDEGRVLIGGRDVTGDPPAARDLAFVFQRSTRSIRT